MKRQAPLSNEDQNLLFMPGLFHETMDIIFDSYEYFQLQDKINEGHIPPYLQTIYSHEMSRITMRLTSVMAWLMARKAVLSGQLSDEEASSEYRLDGTDICLQSGGDLQEVLPAYLIELLDKSLKLYERVWRLDAQLYNHKQSH